MAVLAVPPSSNPVPFNRTPYLQNVHESGASILWTTLVPGRGAVMVSRPEGESRTITASMRTFLPVETSLDRPFYQYQADITGLEAGRLYIYRVAMDGHDLAENPAFYRFRTARPGNFSFLVVGDSGADTPEQHELVERMATERGIGLILHTGDLVYPHGGFARYDLSFFGPNARMRQLPVFPTPGNHDYLDDDGASYRAGMVFPDSGVPAADHGRYYSFNWGDAHFVSLDSNRLPTRYADRMLEWLDRDLANTRKFWKIVYFHHTPYPTGHHINDPVCALARSRVTPIVERHGVQLVLAAHEHAYERSSPLRNGATVSGAPSTLYVVSGGGGAQLHWVGSQPHTARALSVHHYLRVDAEGGRMTIRAVGLKGEEIDRVTLAPEPVISAKGIGSAGDFAPALAPGSLASLFGLNLATQEVARQKYPLPAELGEIQVTVGNMPAPLLFVSPGQVNFQVPYGEIGKAAIQVTTPNGTAKTERTLSATAPSILAVMSEAKLVTAEQPAHVGKNVSIYATGLGAVAGRVAAGQAAADPAPAVTADVQVWFGNTVVRPSSAGLAAGMAGVYRVDALLPAGFGSGTFDLRLSAGEAFSRPVACSATATP
ncbi:MAG: metallophosphoesterase [Bryobacteraceae bacterium]|nr:metallophosphoesterase [Bryobacteraceae bacterium]